MLSSGEWTFFNQWFPDDLLRHSEVAIPGNRNNKYENTRLINSFTLFHNYTWWKIFKNKYWNVILSIHLLPISNTLYRIVKCWN